MGGSRRCSGVVGTVRAGSADQAEEGERMNWARKRGAERERAEDEGEGMRATEKCGWVGDGGGGWRKVVVGVGWWWQPQKVVMRWCWFENRGVRERE